jgi:hypothetical protein
MKLLMLDCNVTIKGYQGAIELPKLENMRTDKCAWTIIAPKRSTVNITFTSLKLFHSRFIRFMAPIYSNSKVFKYQCTKSQLNVSINIGVLKIFNRKYKFIFLTKQIFFYRFPKELILMKLIQLYGELIVQLNQFL